LLFYKSERFLKGENHVSKKDANFPFVVFVIIVFAYIAARDKKTRLSMGRANLCVR